MNTWTYKHHRKNVHFIASPLFPRHHNYPLRQVSTSTGSKRPQVMVAVTEEILLLCSDSDAFSKLCSTNRTNFVCHFPSESEAFHLSHWPPTSLNVNFPSSVYTRLIWTAVLPLCYSRGHSYFTDCFKWSLHDTLQS